MLLRALLSGAERSGVNHVELRVVAANLEISPEKLCEAVNTVSEKKVDTRSVTERFFDNSGLVSWTDKKTKAEVTRFKVANGWSAAQCDPDPTSVLALCDGLEAVVKAIRAAVKKGDIPAKGTLRS